MKVFFKRVYAWGKAVVKSFLDHHCSLHAAGLTYFSMLALIPVLCCVLVAAKTANVDKFARDKINEQIDSVITDIEKSQVKLEIDASKMDPREVAKLRKKKIASEEFAQQARSFSNQIFARIDKFNIRRMGVIGIAMLLWTVISSLGHVEISMDEIWEVPKPRPIWKKAYLYLFIVTIIPVFAALAMSMPILNVVKNIIIATMGSTWLTKWASDGLVWFIDFWAFRALITIGFASLAFGYFLGVMPNCKVRCLHAWYGGILTAVLFGAVMKVCAIAQVGIAKSSALYGSFAFLPIVLAWFYMSWQVILLGASVVRAFDVVSKMDFKEKK